MRKVGQLGRSSYRQLIDWEVFAFGRPALDVSVEAKIDGRTRTPCFGSNTEGLKKMVDDCPSIRPQLEPL